MYLCHKCAGVLLSEEQENTEDLLGCSCISGYYRGFEPKLNRKEAIAKQIARQIEWIELYTRQNRTNEEIEYV